MGCGLFFAFARHVRDWALVGIAPPAGAGAGPPGDQATLSAPARPRRLLRLGAENVIRPRGDSARARFYGPALLSIAQLRSLSLYPGGRHRKAAARPPARMAGRLDHHRALLDPGISA